MVPVFLYGICYLPVDLHYQHRPAADVSHLISVPPGFPGLFLMAYSEAQLKSNGDKVSPCLDHLDRKHIREVFTYMKFIVGFI
jgi:hypothetical protein